MQNAFPLEIYPYLRVRLECMISSVSSDNGAALEVLAAGSLHVRLFRCSVACKWPFTILKREVSYIFATRVSKVIDEVYELVLIYRALY